MFVWTKFANGADRDSWEARLHSIEDASIVLSETVGRSNLRIDAYCTARKTAEALKAENGGRITVLKQQDWVAISGQPKSPPLKIRDRPMAGRRRPPADRFRVPRVRHRWKPDAGDARRAAGHAQAACQTAPHPLNAAPVPETLGGSGRERA